MCGECNWPIKTEKIEDFHRYRYACPNCNRTWLDADKELVPFCWNCGQKTVNVQKASETQNIS